MSGNSLKQPLIGAGRRSAAFLAPTLLALTLAGGCGESDSKSPRSTGDAAPTTTTAANANTETPAKGAAAAAAELRRHGALIAGWNSAEAIRDVDDCVPSMRANELECRFGEGDGMEPKWVAIRLQGDGTVTRVLAFAKPRPGTKTSAQVEKLLARDDREMVAPAKLGGYTCAASPRLEPDGPRSTADAAAVGQRCTVTHRIDRKHHVRYVEFAADGTAVRDYEVPQR